MEFTPDNSQRFVLTPEQDQQRLTALYDEYGDLRDQIYAEYFLELKEKWQAINNAHTSRMFKTILATAGIVILILILADGFWAGALSAMAIFVGGFVLYNDKAPQIWEIPFNLPGSLQNEWEGLEERRLNRRTDRDRWAKGKNLCSEDATVVIEHDEYAEYGGDFLAPWVEAWFK